MRFIVDVLDGKRREAGGVGSGNQIMMDPQQESFGFPPRSAIDQPLLSHNRQYDLTPVIEEHLELLGIGIDKNTAVVVQNDTIRVVGESKAAVNGHCR